MDTVADDAIAVRLADFRSALRDQTVSDLDIVREFVTHGSCAMLDRATHARVRRVAASALGVHPNRDVYTVGSAQLGFSLKPHAMFRAFGDESDVDLAIVSEVLYHEVWDEVRVFHSNKGLWEPDRLRGFRSYHLKGRIRIEDLPVSPSVPSQRRLFDIQRSLQAQRAAGPYPVKIALWHSIRSLEDYQAAGVAACRVREGL